MNNTNAKYGSRKQSTKECIIWLCKYYNYSMNDTMHNYWVKQLEVYDGSIIAQAMREHINTSERSSFPALGEIFKLVKKESYKPRKIQ